MIILVIDQTSGVKVEKELQIRMLLQVKRFIAHFPGTKASLFRWPFFYGGHLMMPNIVFNGGINLGHILFCSFQHLEKPAFFVVI